MADNFQSKSLPLKEVSKVYHSNIIKIKKKKSLPEESTASNENKNYNNPPP